MNYPDNMKFNQMIDCGICNQALVEDIRIVRIISKIVQSIFAESQAMQMIANDTSDVQQSIKSRLETIDQMIKMVNSNDVALYLREETYGYAEDARAWDDFIPSVYGTKYLEDFEVSMKDNLEKWGYYDD